MNSRWMDSPIGGLRLSAVDGSLTSIAFDAEPVDARAAHAVLDEAERQLEEYFAGERTVFDLPLAARGTTFQQQVWREVSRVAYGDTAGYGEIAARLGLAPGVSRAIGAANGANPLPIVVPCHRVIGRTGSLTGYAGGLARKRFLLELEQPGLF